MQANRNRSSRVTQAVQEAILKKKKEPMKAAVQLVHGLNKWKLELLQGYLMQMKTCLKPDETHAQQCSMAYLHVGDRDEFAKQHR